MSYFFDVQFKLGQKKSFAEVLGEEQPRDVKMTLKNSADDPKLSVQVLNKKWLRRRIPHIKQVIADVKENEGVEITINCNVEAFDWIIKRLKFED